MLVARTGMGGMVTAPHHLAAEAGADILREGGNAIEAMVAAAATIAVVYPHMNAIGGDGFWLISAPGAEPIAIRACGPAADLATLDAYADADAIPARGPRAALTVAGAIAGWAEALAVAEGLGARLPLSRLLSDAIGHGRDGIVVTRSQAALTAEKAGELLGQPGFKTIYAPLGPPAEGTVLRQTALADTLARLASAGLDDFYRGDLARAVAAGLEAAGSPLRLADLERYRATRVAPIKADLAQGTVYNLPPPTQGVSSLMILGLYERLGVPGAEADGFAHIHGLVEATKRAFILRNAHLGDQDAMDPGWRDWLSDPVITREAAQIDRNRAAPWPHPAKPGDTIWMGAVDVAGIAVSYIQSTYWEFGSGVIAGDTGVVWQNRGAGFSLLPGPNQLAPGKLPFHTLNPALARLNDGRTLSYGTMGGEGQPQTQALLYTRHVTYGQDLQQAVSAPRFLLGRTWGEQSTNLKLENRFDPELIEDLRQAGHDLAVHGPYEDIMGHAGMVSIDQDGVIRGAADPRADGAAAGV